MKKSVVLFASILVAIGLFGCSSGSVNETTTAQTESYTTIPKPIVTEPTTKEEIIISYEDIFMPSNMRFDMAAAEIEDNEIRYKTFNFSEDGVTYLSYRGSKNTYYEMYVDCVYCVVDNKLKTYWCEFDKESYKIDSFFWLYQDVKREITNKYGDCISEDIIWTDDTYKNNSGMWDKAFEYGYVTINTRWEIENNQVILIKWNYLEGLYVITTTSNNENNL